MNREIKFRGKLCHSDAWEYGNLLISENKDPYIYPFEVIIQDGHHLRLDSDEAHWVIPETVGQFTGLHDKNGKEIYEGDIIHTKIGEIYSVVWNEFRCCMSPLNKYTEKPSPEEVLMCSRNLDLSWVETYQIIVIGNIHDSPELLKTE